MSKNSEPPTGVVADVPFCSAANCCRQSRFAAPRISWCSRSTFHHALTSNSIAKNPNAKATRSSRRPSQPLSPKNRTQPVLIRPTSPTLRPTVHCSGHIGRGHSGVSDRSNEGSYCSGQNRDERRSQKSLLSWMRLYWVALHLS